MSDPIKPAEACSDMQDVRAAIDAIDRELVLILARRQGYIDAAARIKQSRAAVRDEARIADVLEKVKAAASAAGLAPSIAEQVWRALMEASIAREFVEFDRLKAG